MALPTIYADFEEEEPVVTPCNHHFVTTAYSHLIMYMIQAASFSSPFCETSAES